MVSNPQGQVNPGSSAERLDSWKEIAAYLRRGARTVQRWEREQSLPVHRLQHDKLGSVYAYKSELDAWWRGRAGLQEGVPSQPECEPSVAVLPFRDLSREQDQEYFCEGIAEEIIATLSKVRDLRVASRTSSFRYKAADLGEVGRRLRVRAVLEGSVRKSEERLRIVVQLSDVQRDRQLWSQTYDRQMDDIFAIQQEIACSVADSLEIVLGPNETAALREVPTQNILAYDCYLRGRKFYYGYGPQDIEFAIQMFVRATGLDAGYALAYAGLADCWSYIYIYSDRSETVRGQSDWASARALELAPESAQAHASRALSLSICGRDEEAEAAFETAIRLDPGLFEAYYFYARHAFVRGQAEKAARFFEEAARVCPESYQAPLLLGQVYDSLGRRDEARAVRETGVAAAKQHLSLNPDDARAYYMCANGMVALGHRESGRQWAERALSLKPDDPMLLYNVGCIYAMLGSVEEAISCLEKAVRKGLTQKGWYEHDNNLDPLRSHPRFKKLIRQLKYDG